jgi:hypothetical protein
VPGGEVGELALEVGQALGQTVALLAQRLSCRLDVRCEVLVAIRSMPRRVVHASSDSEQERCRDSGSYTLRASASTTVHCDICDPSIGQAGTPEIRAKPAC